ncbi:stAR-related lipid transfer protein 13 isoform X3 [Trichogramma pretiosum]|uniref:stAR-related lipid transfer protein 13 isoform X3 n=1 Tax=Trichogramma pretiosum TaxID=7493 RepID=UPI0006C94379|nr:stAR-related lipid transfer protein 13 isoform X3 [Trichogramma pretiosum]
MEAIQNSNGPISTQRINDPNNGRIMMSLLNPLRIVENGDARDTAASQEPQKDVDPFQELEMYLSKVNAEISEIIFKNQLALQTSYHDPPSSLVVPLAIQNSTDDLNDSLVDSLRTDSEDSGSSEQRRQDERDKELNWSEEILHELSTLITYDINEIVAPSPQKNSKSANHSKKRYKEIIHQLGLARNESSEEEERSTKDNERSKSTKAPENVDSHDRLLNLDYSLPRDQILNESRNGHWRNGNSSDYDEPNDSLKQRAHMNSSLPRVCNAQYNLPKKNQSEERRSSPLIKPSTDPMPRSNRMLYAGLQNGTNEPGAQLPPQPSHSSKKKTKLFSATSKRQSRSAEKVEPDYEEIRDREIDHLYEVIPGRLPPLEGSMSQSAPSTPPATKRTSFSKFLMRKQNKQSIYQNASADSILVEASPVLNHDFINRGSSLKKNRAVSPISVHSDASAKRLSESSKDAINVSPVELRKSKHKNDVAVNCTLHNSIVKHTSAGNISTDSASNEKDLRDVRRVTNDDKNVGSSTLPLSFHSLLTRLTGGSSSSRSRSPPSEGFPCLDMATQTSPGVSRSSSFTWISDCDSPHQDARSLQEDAIINTASPQNTVDDDNRSSSSSQDPLQSMDEISSGSLSPDAADRASPLESGIGTASPPRSTERRLAKPPACQSTNLPTDGYCKETWERIRRRPSKLLGLRQEFPYQSSDVWVKRESVHTQTRTQEEDKKAEHEARDSSSGYDDSLPRARSSSTRPDNLPFGLLSANSANSSSLSSNELVATNASSTLRALSSPSTESLQLRITQSSVIELPSKSTSAPFLDNGASALDNENTENSSRQQPRSQSERQLSEIEAQEACKWLRAAGFPQYAQMYEDYQFPIDVNGVAKDHPFLDADSLQSLFRRLHALNRCATMKLDTHHHHHHHLNTHHNASHGKSGGGGHTEGDDSDEDTQCALSENWTFEKKTRRWSRVCDITPGNVERLQALATTTSTTTAQGQSRVAGGTAEEDNSLEEGSSRLEQDEVDDTMLDTLRYRTLPTGVSPGEELTPRFRRTGSERLRDGAKAFLRLIGAPQVVDVAGMERKMRDMNCVDVSPTDGAPPVSFADLLPLPPASPQPPPASPLAMPPSPFQLSPSPLANNTTSPFGDDSSSYASDGSQGGGPTPPPLTKPKMSKAKRFLHRSVREDQGALSDSECQPTSWRHRYFKDANSNNAKVLEFVTSSPRESPMKSPGSNIVTSTPISTRGGSLNLGKDSQRYRDKYSAGGTKEDKVSALKREHKSFSVRHHRTLDEPIRAEKVIAKEVTVFRADNMPPKAAKILRGTTPDVVQESSSSVTLRGDSDPEEDSPRHKGNVVRWHSFQRGSLYPEPLNPLCPRAMASMSCGQLMVLRKLALLKLTACMERYCPTHRTGWNWELPKFIRKIKTPDYKDKTVFGVPLLLSLQRTGQALPKCVQIALRWLRANALDQVGIFRKSGVRSRIQKLKTMTESLGDNINFDGQQAYDVADLVKQYFRELPEALLTNKLSETFIAIFQHVPGDLRPEAVQSVLLLLPDEHREALETLLDFLHQVANNSPYNQMTASNLAVCLAPSLFHFNHSAATVSSSNRSNSVSPRRRKTVGVPDQRELAENKAAHDCLLHLIKTNRELFMVSSDMLTQCHFNYMEESIPVPLEQLGAEIKQDWRGYLYACTAALLKEGREKYVIDLLTSRLFLKLNQSRGWVSVNNPADNSVDVAYKKVGDGHPLRLWRVSTEVEAPPEELLHRVLRERHIWDPQLLKYRQVVKLESNAEVFQYATGNMSPLPARDYCVLRSWQTDLPKKACVIVETSVEHPDASVMLGGTRGIVLASRYLIEHCGSGKSRIMHLSRVDTKGRTPEWYNKSYGHIAALHLSKIRASFKHTADGPESKV